MSWEAVGVAVSLLVFFGGILVAIIKALLVQYQRHIDKRFETLEQTTRERMDGYQTVRDELKDFKLHVAQHYVHRDDYIRAEGGRDVTLRHINSQLEELKLLIHARPQSRKTPA